MPPLATTVSIIFFMTLAWLQGWMLNHLVESKGCPGDDAARLAPGNQILLA